MQTALLFLALWLAGFFFMRPHIRDWNTTSRVLAHLTLLLLLWSVFGQSAIQDLRGARFFFQKRPSRRGPLPLTVLKPARLNRLLKVTPSPRAPPLPPPGVRAPAAPACYPRRPLPLITRRYTRSHNPLV